MKRFQSLLGVHDREGGVQNHTVTVMREQVLLWSLASMVSIVMGLYRLRVGRKSDLLRIIQCLEAPIFTLVIYT